MTWHGSIAVLLARLAALLLVTLTSWPAAPPCLGPSASGAPITDIDQIAGKWAGTINSGHQGFADPFYLTIMPDGKLIAGWDEYPWGP